MKIQLFKSQVPRPGMFFFLLVSLLAVAQGVRSQTPTDFSGTWVFNASKSNFGNSGYFSTDDEILKITQDATALTIERTMIPKGGEEYVSTEAIGLDGMENIQKEGDYTTKMFIRWSADQKVLSQNTIVTNNTGGAAKEYIMTVSYTLSDDKKTLSITGYSKNPDTGEDTITLVYDKK